MAAKVRVNPIVDVNSQEYTHDFDRQYFTVSQLRLWPTLEEKFSFEPIVDQADHFDHERGMIQGEAASRIV
jgi:hypothetical protein